MPSSKRILALLSIIITAASALAQKATYAPTPPPLLFAKPKSEAAIAQTQPSNQYIIGDPTDEEQMHLELINRARADAVAEAERLIALSFVNQDVRDQFEVWSVDTNLLKLQFATNPPAAPLSMNSKLTDAARGHSQYQFDNAVQTHDETNPATANLSLRVNATGYLWATLGENVFTDSTSPEHGHAGFDVDWGPGPGGMQSPPGHRNTIHNRNLTEVGIGIVKGFNTVNGNTVGPQIVTEDFARPQAGTIFITGVAYYDINGNNFYDMGEGLPGVQVTVDGVSTFAITARSGGYSVPVPPNATYTVRFNSTGRAQVSQTAGVSTSNVKLDFKPSYVVPNATGPSTAYVGIDNIYTIAPLPDATGYRARVTELSTIAPEGFEGTIMDRWLLTLPGDYPFTSTAVKASGAQSLHVGQAVVNGTVFPQLIELRQAILVGANAHIDFKSLMAVASTVQFAALEVSRDEGVTWTEIWSQHGADVAGEEKQFSAKSGSLAAFEGEIVHVRFIFDAGNGSVYTLPSDPSSPNFDHIGWFLDDVSFVNVQGVGTASEAFIGADGRFDFKPTSLGTYSLEFAPTVGTRFYEFGPARQVSVAANPPSVSLMKSMILTDTNAMIQFVVSGGAAANFQLETATSLNGPWALDTAATLSSQGGSVYTFTRPRTSETRFFRVVAN